LVEIFPGDGELTRFTTLTFADPTGMEGTASWGTIGLQYAKKRVERWHHDLRELLKLSYPLEVAKQLTVIERGTLGERLHVHALYSGPTAAWTTATAAWESKNGFILDEVLKSRGGVQYVAKYLSKGNTMPFWMDV
jgi:Cys-tRNA synthase (O-phospho-L-seryl-tRNA:Cys-tRNA synthase)